MTQTRPGKENGDQESKKRQQLTDELNDRKLLTMINESAVEAMQSVDAISESQWLELAKEQVEAKERDQTHHLN